MKGKVQKYEFYLANAKLLVEDTSYFYGEDFSWGDKNILVIEIKSDEEIKEPQMKIRRNIKLQKNILMY